MIPDDYAPRDRATHTRVVFLSSQKEKRGRG